MKRNRRSAIEAMERDGEVSEEDEDSEEDDDDDEEADNIK